MTAEQEAAAQRDQACARELGEADNAVAAAERVCHERKLRALLERRSTAAAHMQEAFAALRGAAAKVDAAENEIQLFLQTEATEGEKPALRQLRHTLAHRKRFLWSFIQWRHIHRRRRRRRSEKVGQNVFAAIHGRRTIRH